MAKASYLCPQCSAKITIVEHNRQAANEKAEHLEQQGRVCFACRCKNESEKAKKDAEIMKIPVLEGSEKQIAWAETIRMGFLKMDLPDIVRKWLCEQTSAKFFIDNRLPHEMKMAFRAWLAKEKQKENPEQKEENKEEVKPTEKANWKKFELNIQNISYETDLAYRIKMPHSSKYDGFEFWVSKKLCRGGAHYYAMFISVLSNMQFKLQRLGKREVLDEKIISSEEMIKAFGGERKGFSYFDVVDNVEIVRHTPPVLQPEKVEVDATLIK